MPTVVLLFISDLKAEGGCRGSLPRFASYGVTIRTIGSYPAGSLKSWLIGSAPISQVTQICVSSFQFYFTQMLLYKVQYQLHVLIPQSFVIFSKQLKSFSYSILIFYTTFHIIFASMIWAMFPCPQWFTFFIFLIGDLNKLYIIFS